MPKRKKKNGTKALELVATDAGQPTPEFLAKHAVEKVKTDQGKALRTQDKRPIDSYYRLYCIDRDRGIAEHRCRGINDEQFNAADMLSSNYERSMHSASVNLDAVRIQTSINAAMYPIESITNAIHVHVRLMKKLSEASKDIVESVCCHESSLIAYERAKGWRKGYGMIRLREGLDELANACRNQTKRRNP